MHRLAAIAFLAVFWAGSANAGAWLRAEGTGFLSLDLRGYERGGTPAGEIGLYAEHGLRPRLTVGLTGTLEDDQTGEARGFLRFPLLKDDQPYELSAEIGIGTAFRIGESAGPKGYDLDPFFQAGVSWGRGLRFGDRNGWANVDAALQHPFDDGETLLKIDATLGVTLTERLQVIGQVFWERDRFGTSTTFAPSAIIALKERGSKLVIGAEFRTGRAERTALRLGMWREF